MTKDVSATVICGVDIGGERLALYTTIRSGKHTWFYPGFATRDALRQLSENPDLADVFYQYQLSIVARALCAWRAQPTRMTHFRIELGNVHLFGDFVSAG